MTKEQLKNIIITDLTGDVMHFELTDSVVLTNIDRAVMISSDYFNYVNYKTLDVTQTSSSGGYIPLNEIDPDGIPVITAIYPTQATIQADAALLGLGSFYISGISDLFSQQMNTYAQMMSKLSQLESILGRNARVVGDKLYVDKLYNKITVEYIPEIVDVDKIHEGLWIRWIIDYAKALTMKQLAFVRGKHTVSSNPWETNAATLLEQANTDIEKLENELEFKGILKASR